MKRQSEPPRPAAISSWLTLAAASIASVTVFLVALGVVAWWRRDVPLAERRHSDTARTADAGHVDDATHPFDGGRRDAGDDARTADAGAGDDGSDDTGTPTRDARAADAAAHDAGAQDAGASALDVDGALVAFVATHGAELVACVRDAARRDPATSDELSLAIAVDRDHVSALTVRASPSPFAERCFVDVVSLPADAPGTRVVVDLRVRASELVIERVTRQ